MYKEEYSDEKIICPYCKTEREPDYECGDYEEDKNQEECSECGKTYYISLSCHWSWSTSQNCKINGETHNWVDEHPENHLLGSISKHNPDKIYVMCEKCGQTRYVDKKEINK